MFWFVSVRSNVFLQMRHEITWGLKSKKVVKSHISYMYDELEKTHLDNIACQQRQFKIFVLLRRNTVMTVC